MKQNRPRRPRRVSRLGTPRPVVVSCPSAGLLTGGFSHLSPSRDNPSGIREALAAYSCGGSSVYRPRPERIPFSFPKETDAEISCRISGPPQARYEWACCQSYVDRHSCLAAMPHPDLDLDYPCTGHGSPNKTFMRGAAAAATWLSYSPIPRHSDRHLGQERCCSWPKVQ